MIAFGALALTSALPAAAAPRSAAMHADRPSAMMRVHDYYYHHHRYHHRGWDRRHHDWRY